MRKIQKEEIEEAMNPMTEIEGVYADLIKEIEGLRTRIDGLESKLQKHGHLDGKVVLPCN